MAHTHTHTHARTPPSPRGRHAGTLCVQGADVTVPLRPRPRPQAYAAVTVKPSSPARLLRAGAVILISGAVLLLFGTIAAFYFWKGSDSHVGPGRVRGAGRCAGPPCPPRVSPLGGARAPVPSIRFPPGASGAILCLLAPNPARSLLSACTQLCRKASQGFKGEY